MCGFFNVCVYHVCVCFVMGGFVYVGLCICWFCNVRCCVCVVFLMCDFVFKASPI